MAHKNCLEYETRKYIASDPNYSLPDGCRQRYYIQDGNSLTYNVSVKSRNLSIVLSVYCMYIQKLVVGYVELSFPIKKYM